jgi:hypothetical protein
LKEEAMRRVLGLALAATMLVPAAATAQDDDAWPTTDQRRAELQVIGYQFAYAYDGR